MKVDCKSEFNHRYCSIQPYIPVFQNVPTDVGNCFNFQSRPKAG